MITFNEIPAAISQLQADLKELIAYIKGNEVSEPSSDFITRQELAAMLKVNLSTIHNWVKTRRIKKYCLGGRVYFNRKEILAYLQKTK
jgi:excisionase family DNA binding protein